MPSSSEAPLNRREQDRGLSYVDRIREAHRDSHIWDYLRYNREGDLWLDGVRLADVIQFGTPLEIVDTRIVKRRANEWVELTRRIAQEVGYQGGFKDFYASKANMSLEVAATAYAAGWLQETTSTQDLINIEYLLQQRLLRKESTDIICNGFFLPSQNFGNPRESKDIRSPNVIFQADGAVEPAGEISYLSRIESMRDQGYRITPIIYDRDELRYLLTKKGAFNIGLRLKFGKVTNDTDLAQLQSRFGMTWEELQEAANLAGRSDNQLRFTMLHAMVGAAENIPIDTFDRSLQFAAEKYFELRAKHDTLQYLNIGGGIPPRSEKYDHEELIRRFLRGVKDKAMRANLPEPTIVFELGSYIATEAAFDILKIVDYKHNHIDANGNPGTWAIGDSSLVATVPDIWFLKDKRFIILAVNGANRPAKLALHGDITCDSGSILPEGLLIPDTTDPLYLVILGTGAYQNALTGEGGGQHCGLYGSAKWKIHKEGNKTVVVLTGRQTSSDLSRILGYTPDRIRHLRRS